MDGKTVTNDKSATVRTAVLFAMVWVLFCAAYRAFPYVKNGSDVVFGAKLRIEERGRIFPDDAAARRVLIFGNSKVLAGFLPSRFDQLGGHVVSFNSGFPGSDLYLPALAALCAHGQAPNILLLTLPWNADPPRRSVFHFLPDDHAAAETLFPFRYLVRDASAFLIAAPSHGGILRSYHDAEAAESRMVAARGYYLITEQSHFPGGRLPDDFHPASDNPGRIVPRVAPAAGTQVTELNQLIRSYRMECFYVPFYLREGEAAPAANYDQPFAAQVAHSTGCRLIGPDYFLYPNRLFADQTHLNQAGARVYTEALYQLLRQNTHALQ